MQLGLSGHVVVCYRTTGQWWNIRGQAVSTPGAWPWPPGWLRRDRGRVWQATRSNKVHAVCQWWQERWQCHCCQVYGVTCISPLLIHRWFAKHIISVWTTCSFTFMELHAVHSHLTGHLKADPSPVEEMRCFVWKHQCYSLGLQTALSFHFQAVFYSLLYIMWVSVISHTHHPISGSKHRSPTYMLFKGHANQMKVGLIGGLP